MLVEIYNICLQNEIVKKVVPEICIDRIIQDKKKFGAVIGKFKKRMVYSNYSILEH